MPGIPSKDASFVWGTPRNYALTIFKALLLPLFTENEDGAFTLSTDSQGAIKALSAVVHNVAKA